jgi:hypothetical protein
VSGNKLRSLDVVVAAMPHLQVRRLVCLPPVHKPTDSLTHSLTHSLTYSLTQ